jgi:hypothetical protein
MFPTHNGKTGQKSLRFMNGEKVYRTSSISTVASATNGVVKIALVSRLANPISRCHNGQFQLRSPCWISECLGLSHPNAYCRDAYISDGMG